MGGSKNRILGIYQIVGDKKIFVLIPRHYMKQVCSNIKFLKLIDGKPHLERPIRPAIFFKTHCHF